MSQTSHDDQGVVTTDAGADTGAYAATGQEVAALELRDYWGPVYDELEISRDQAVQITITCEKADTKGVVEQIAEDWVALKHDPGIGSKEQRFWIARHQINRVVVPTGN